MNIITSRNEKYIIVVLEAIFEKEYSCTRPDRHQKLFCIVQAYMKYPYSEVTVFGLSNDDFAGLII